jgi:hypothetical protein
LVAAAALLLAPAAQAQGLQLGTVNVPVTVPEVATTITVPTNVLGTVVNVPVNLPGAVNSIVDLPATTVTVPVNILGTTVSVSVNVPAVSVTVTGGPVTIDLPIGIDLPIPINLPLGLTETIAALDVIAAARRNDALLGLDLGLDRQIDILTSGNGHWDDDVGLWSERSGLGGPRLSGSMLDGWSASPGRLASFSDTFATSLQQQTRQAPAAPGEEPYRLGATSRSPPPARRAFDVWVEGAFARFEDGSAQSERHGHLGVVYAGADYRLAPNILVGALIQYNETSHAFDALPGGGSDSGWMVGPYATVRLSPNVFFQARAAWGRTDVKVDLDDALQDKFDAERWLVRGTLLGQWRWGAWQFRPRASVGYIEEHQESYASVVGTTIPSQTIALGQAKLGPELAYRYRLANGAIVEPRLLVEGIWNFLRDGGSVDIDDLAFGEEVRARAEAGVSLRTAGGATIGAAVSYDGIGSGDFQAVGGRLRVQVPLD